MSATTIHESMSAGALSALLAVLLANCGAAVAQARVVASVEQSGVTAQKLADTTGDTKNELVLVQQGRRNGPAALIRLAVESDDQVPTTHAFVERGRILLDDPDHTLIAIENLLPGPGCEVIIATRKRTACYPWIEAKGEATAPIVLARMARFNIRVDEPQLSPFVIDLNKDGLLDLMLPSLRGVQPFFQERADDAGKPRFRRMAIVTVPVGTSAGTGSGGLDQELTGSVRVPQIQTEDLNGDGRPDLLTREGNVRAFHLQRADGTFADPITIDITQFRDSTPKAVMDLGTTAVLSDAQLMQRGDINADGIPDHVIAHRRKLWTFLGNASGPQFQKARTQAVADDVTQMLLLDLDSDKRDDLLTFRVQLPGIGTIVLGLVQSIDIDVRAVGYPSEQNGFANKPKWRRTVTVRVPPLLSLLGRQEELIDRFLNLVGKARISARGSFASDTQQDLVLVTEDGKAIELYPNVPAAPKLDTQEGGRMLHKLLFEDEDTVFDLDRVFNLISGFLDRLGDQTVGDRKATMSLALRDPESWILTGLEVSELNGEPGAELLAIYQAADDDSTRAYDVIAWR